jgi:carbamoyltransferase
MYLTEYPGHTKMYEAVTQYCGFPAIEAGKLMGLAPYGSENAEIPSFFKDGWGNRDMIIPTYPNAAQINYQRYKVLSDDIKNHTQGIVEYTQVQKDMAYKIQEETSNRMVELIRKAHELTGEKNIIICGGYGLNCVANYKYWKEFPDFNIYCEPISHDGGTSIGGAKYVYHQVTGNTSPQKQESVYYGPQYDPSTYENDLKDLEVTDTSYDEVAKLIREGNIVTMYQGRSEGGPRALGNRSILFDPTIEDGKEIVNTVKHREWFRPFACSIKKESVHDWFDLAGREETPHMMYAVQCHEGVEEKIPSVIHVDGTCRIQTVTKDQNEHYHNLIDAFEKLSNVPILFNTSFNLGGDPLVETIEDAIETLKRCDIEYMYLPEIQKLIAVKNIVEE